MGNNSKTQYEYQVKKQPQPRCVTITQQVLKLFFII